MTPQFFIQKWRRAALTERAAAQSHFNDLCALLGEPTPTDADPAGDRFAFEKGARKTGGGQGWADVWKQGCFAWEYKAKHKDLNAALRQLQQYALALDNPPLLIVCDLDTIEIHTHFTNTVHTVHRLTLDDLADGQRRQLLKWAFTDPDRLKPAQTTAAVTAQAAETFAQLAQRLRERGHEPRRVAHFITRLLFCMFAEDIGLLPPGLFTRLLAAALPQPDRFVGMAQSLFAAMSSGGAFGVEMIAWFNGGLFNDPDVIPLDAEDVRIAHRAALLDWSAIEPAIFGTLFERGLDPDKRSQLGAHYTDRASIERLIAPVIRAPLRAEWQAVKVAIAARLAKTTPKARQQAEQALNTFLERLRNFRVLDPACGSGNFLYLALQTLKDLEHQIMLEAEELGLQRGFPAVGPEAVWGIEINPYAAELARVTVWIGEIQWMLSRGYSLNDQPILKPLDQILCRDALLNADGTEAEWPQTDVIVGNPPFLGGSKMLGLLGKDYTNTLRRIYQGRVPGGADLVCYWFEKARALIEQGKVRRAGLVATNSIRGGANRKVLERILSTPLPQAGEGPGVRARIFNAWSDEDWVNEGAAVRVSLVCFGVVLPSPSGRGVGGEGIMLDGQPVVAIHADLTGSTGNSSDLTEAKPLAENTGVCCYGSQEKGSFQLSREEAIHILIQPNPNSRPSSDVVKQSVNARILMQRGDCEWVVDFGVDISEVDAMLYEAPYEHIRRVVYPERMARRDKSQAKRWWLHARPSPVYRRFLQAFSRIIITPAVAKHRVFAWLTPVQLADHALIVVGRDDDTTFGILHSRFHELWALRTCTWLGKGNDPRYTPTTTFETFPFPEGLQPNIPASAYANDPRAHAIANAARRLVELRDHWLNPPEWIRRVPEVVPGYPDRLIPVDDHAAAELKKRTLTNLYNQRPAWLANAHRALDEAVAAAYGWPMDLSDDDILWRLLVLNRERANTRIT